MMNRNKFSKTLTAVVPAVVAIPKLGPISIKNFIGHESFDFKTGSRAGEDKLIIYDREIIQDGHI